MGMGMEFYGIFIPVPVPENWIGIFHLDSRSRKWEWNLPFPVPVPEVQKSFPLTAGPKIGGEAKTQEVVQDGGDNCCNFVSHLLCLSCDHPRQCEPRFYLDPFVCHRNELLKALSVLVKRSAGLGHVRDEGLV